MRTTIRVDDELLREAKKLAAATGRTLAAVIEDALREALSRRPAERRGEPVRLRTSGGRGLLPGVDLNDSASLRDLSLRDLMEGWS